MTSTSDHPRQRVGMPGPPRFQQGTFTTALQLGPLASLPGTWKGAGFHAIWRPDNNQPPRNREHPLPAGHPGSGPAHRHDGDEYAAIRAIEPFWPEETYLQLQYSQLVILLFNQILWPHVTVATLTLSAG